MSRRKDPAAAVIEFFEHAPPDAAQAILGVCKSIVKRRLAGTPGTANPGRAAAGDSLTPSQAAGFTTTATE